MSSKTALLLGTAKGLFLYTHAHGRWDLRGPMLAGWEIGGICVVGSRWLVGTSHMAYGPVIRVSDDEGHTWRQIEHSPAFTPDSGLTMKRIWQIVPGGEPDTLLAGAEPAALFISRDRGESWQPVPGFNDHPTRAAWAGGSCPLCVHTILTHPHRPGRLWAAVSSSGVLRSDDGGASWSVCNGGLPGASTPGFPGPRAHVQKIAQDPQAPDTLVLQHHDGGAFRTTDGADGWRPVNEGLPTRFGFALCTTPAGDTLSIPLDPRGRYFPEGRAAVYRLRRGQDRWERLDQGLSDEPRFTGVLRDALACDGSPTDAGVYFGTSEGSVFAGANGGEAWSALPGRFSRITTLKAWTEG